MSTLHSTKTSLADLLVQADREEFTRFTALRPRVLEPFESYALPAIRLKTETSKEAVCLVSKKVITGGVPRSDTQIDEILRNHLGDSSRLRAP